MELRGCTYFRLEQTPDQRKTLLRSRSFAKPVTAWQNFPKQSPRTPPAAAEKLRNEELVAKVLKVFFHTSLFKQSNATAFCIYNC